MYSLCTGPSPGGGAYCSGNPGEGSTVVRYHRNAPRPNATVSAATNATVVTDCPRMRSQVNGHGRVLCGGVGTSTPTRTVTGVRGGRLLADNSTVSPVTVRSLQPLPIPKPTAHCVWPASPGSVIEISACSIWLFQAGAMTFQKNTDGDSAGWPTELVNCRLAPVV